VLAHSPERNNDETFVLPLKLIVPLDFVVLTVGQLVVEGVFGGKKVKLNSDFVSVLCQESMDD